MTDQSGQQSRVDERFETLAAAVDGVDGPDWLATASPDDQLCDHLDALAAAVAATDGTDATRVPVAEAYQSSLAADERASAGHFVTDAPLATALCRWAIRPRPDGRHPRILDPATGSGAFAVAAADRLATLAPDARPSDRLANVVGIERDSIPLALTADRLLDRIETGNRTESPLSLYEVDFFDVTPSDGRSVTVTDDGIDAGTFDAVVGNPPYVRQETADTDRMRAHLASFGPDGERPYLDGNRALSRRSDAYVYFVTHATRFLRAGGRLGVVVPKKWLTTRYGEPFQQFLLDHYRLHAVVGFESRAFPDALVDTVLLLAERSDDPTARQETSVEFHRLDEQQSVDALLATLDETTGPGAGSGHADDSHRVTVDRSEGRRTVTVQQGDLADRGPGKRAHYLDAPEPLIRLLADAPLTTLGDLGTVRRGVMTGANDFFFLDADSETATAIDDHFLAPAIKSIRDVDSRLLGAADADRYLLDVHDYVDGVDTGSDDATEGDRRQAVLDALVRDGHDALRDYIEWGEHEGYHERRSCAARSVWFDLGPLSAPAVFLPKFFDRRVFAIANPDDLVTSNAVDCLCLPEDADERLVFGLLNSTVTQATLECWGRSEGGGALQLMTYEMATLPVPDPATLDATARADVRAATTALLDGDESARERLDDHVLDALGVDLSVDQLRACRERMVERRVGSSEQVRPPLTLERE